ncbi:MAG: enoyl-CoA hydratase family protein [Acidobacteriota bacterium]|nr:enoyl-CoA hydratase family protein [Blastocatellia bacterium]MDW8413657.1 enoyl-CoA hydratase family protein [Acidobacteriota bacterium]
MTPKTFDYNQQDDGVGVITLNRPERLNALTFEVYRELTDFFRELQHDNKLGAVIITGTGRGFCSGGDVKDIIGKLLDRPADELLKFTRMTCELVANIRALHRPVIAAINGVAAGAGAMIALAADLRIASEEARIAFLFVKVGLSGADMGAAFLLPRIVGLGRATELLYSGDFITAQEAERIGLYNRVVPAADLMNEAYSLAKRLANGPRFGLAMTKQMLNREFSLGLSEALEAEAQAQAICMQHPDYKEAYLAFVEKRKPEFNINDSL